MWSLLDGVGAYDEERGYFALLQRDARDAGKMNLVLAATEGAPLGAWRSPPDATTEPCRLSTAALGSTGAMFAVRSRTDPYYLVYWGALHAIGRVERPVAQLTEGEAGGGVIQEASASALVTAFDVQPASRIFIADDTAVRRMDRLPGGLAGAPFGPEIVGDHVVWEERGTQNRIAHASSAMSTELYYEAAGVDVAFLAVSDRDLAWLEVARVSGTVERAELWTASYVRAPSMLAPRRLYTFDSTLLAPITVGAGRVIVGDVDYVSGSALRIFELASGRVLRYVLPAGHARSPGFFLGVSDTELLLKAVGPDGQTVMRVDLDEAPLEVVP